MARILLADDDAASRDFVKRALSMDGHEVTLAADGAEALSLLSASHAAFDLLITDVHMPALDGLSLAREAAKVSASLPVLLMSGYAVDQARLDATGARIAGLLNKPFSLDEVRARAKAALAAR